MLLPHDQPLKSAHPEKLALSTPGKRLNLLPQQSRDLARLRRLEAVPRFDRQQGHTAGREAEIDLRATGRTSAEEEPPRTGSSG